LGRDGRRPNLKYQRVVEKLAEESADLRQFLHRLEETYPKVENDIAIRQQLGKLPPLGKETTPGELELLLVEFFDLMGKLSPSALSEQEKILLLVGKIHPTQWREMRADKRNCERCDRFQYLVDFWR